MQRGARRRAQCAAWMTAMVCTLAQAQVDWDFSGFASFGAGRLNTEHLEFLDYTDAWSFDSDTMVGVQGIVSPTERLSLTAQVVSRGYLSQDNYDSYRPAIEWLFVSYDLTPDTRVRAGRLRTPHYLFSESLEVGYSYPWVRPPIDMYVPFLEPFSHFDGADIAYQPSLGAAETEFKLFSGRMSGSFLGIDVDVSRVIGATATVRLDDVTVRYGVNTNRTAVTLPSGELLESGYTLAASLDPQTFGGLSEYFYNDHQEYQYHGLGVLWEPGNWSILSESFLLIGPKEKFSFDSRGWYVSIGRQFGEWMPYTVVGDYRTRMDSRILRGIRGTYDEYPEGLGGVFDRLDELRAQSLFALQERNVAQRSNTLGLRWDFHPRADLKFELQYFDFLTNSTGHMLPEDGAEKASDAVLTTILMDVVF